MSRTLGELYEFLVKEDEITVLELLDLTSEELVNAFKYKVRSRKGYIVKFYEDESDGEPQSKEESEEGEQRRMGRKALWEETGIDCEEAED